jgi:hypothetical protein
MEGTGFNICGSREELKMIAAQIQRGAEGMLHGWINIRVPIIDEHQAPVGAETLKWESDERANKHPDQAAKPAADLTSTATCEICGKRSTWGGHRTFTRMTHCNVCNCSTNHKFIPDPS